MKQVCGIWLPDEDTHFPEMLPGAAKLWRRPTYQIDKFLGCLPYIRRFQHVVDIGAHCGLWSIVMARSFARLTAFEPVAEHAECWRKNVEDGNAVLHEIALGDGSVTKIRMTVEKENSGLSHVEPAGGYEVGVTSLDVIGVEAVDFIKCDCEGYEYFALRGAEWTIMRDRPCVLVEQSMGSRYGINDRSAIDLLQMWGAELRWSRGSDHCLSW